MLAQLITGSNIPVMSTVWSVISTSVRRASVTVVACGDLCDAGVGDSGFA